MNKRAAMLSGRAGWASFGYALIAAVIVFAIAIANPLPADDGAAESQGADSQGADSQVARSGAAPDLCAMQVRDFARPETHRCGDGEETVAAVALNATGEMRPSQATAGTLLFRSGSGRDGIPAPLLDTDVVIRVSGMVARAQVRQTFRNPYNDWHEGIYVFPLPENAAVDRLKMRIGERVVEGAIRERVQAKKEYEQARQNGQRAALLEQERPNIFTSSVANTGPREDIVIEIEYQQALRYDSGRFSLRFPMVVAPRYIPGNALPSPSHAIDVARAELIHGEEGASPDPTVGRGWARNTNQVPDASRITPPVQRPEDGALNPVSIRVELDAGMPVARVVSSYHAINQRKVDERSQVIELRSGVTPANRDFALHWEPVKGTAPRTAWFTEKRGDATYGLLMVMPPAAEKRVKRIPREVIFVIDTSGSMSGTSIEQARLALQLAIERIDRKDRFNVIEFNSNARKLFPDALPADSDNREVARRWVGNLQAQGGTEMARALDLALDGQTHPDRVRQVVFLTDAAVGNEEPLLAMLSERLGDSRLFTVGIGSAPNGYFMTKAAQVGRGTFTYIGNVEEVQEKMGELFGKLESPVLKNLRIDWPRDAVVETWPARIPDLYVGEPIVVTAALSPGAAGERARGDARVSGLRGDEQWESKVSVQRDTGSEGVAALWARDKIDALMDAKLDGADGEQTRELVTAVALEHRLVTKYTSLVAVDRTPARPKSEGMRSSTIPTNLPAGWNYDAVFGSAIAGELPQGATDSRFNLLLGGVLLLAGLMLLAAQRSAGRMSAARVRAQVRVGPVLASRGRLVSTSSRWTLSL